MSYGRPFTRALNMSMSTGSEANMSMGCTMVLGGSEMYTLTVPSSLIMTNSTDVQGRMVSDMAAGRASAAELLALV